MKRVALLLAFSATAAGAQAGGQAARPCRITWGQLPATSNSEFRYTPTGQLQMFVGGGFRAWCAGTSRVVVADSAEYYEDQQLVNLIGRARYTEPGTSLSADRIRYHAGMELLEATGNVIMRTGPSTVTAANVIYFRPQPGVRAHSEAYATGRPRVVMRDTATGPAADTTSTVIDADRLKALSDSMFYAGGNVVITRPDLIAHADSMESDRVRNIARLLGTRPRIDGQGENKFKLSGSALDIFGRERQLSRVFAKGAAEADSDSLRLVADTIDIRMGAGGMDSIAAWGGTRSRAFAPGQDIIASTISISMPGQRLRSLFAAGSAKIETRPDSAIRTSERDWLAGDTVTATFTDLRTATDSTASVALNSLNAWGNAQSFYQVPPAAGGDSIPSLSYVVGRRILVDFQRGEIANVRVLDEVRGILLEPVRRDTTTVVRPAAAGRR